MLWHGPAMFGWVQGRAPSSGERDAIVVLGVRHLGQGLLQLGLPHHFGRTYAIIDFLHASSMVALAAAQPARRRAALTSGAVAALAGVYSWPTRPHR